MKVLLSDEEFFGKKTIDKKDTTEISKIINKKVSERRKKLMNDLITGSLGEKDLNKQMKLFNIDYSNSMGIIIVKLLKNNGQYFKSKYEMESKCNEIIGILNKILRDFSCLEIFIDFNMQVVVLSDTTPVKKWHSIKKYIQDNISNLLYIDVLVEMEFLKNDPMNVKIVYTGICNRIKKKSSNIKLILDIQKYIDINYMNEDIDINMLSNKFEVNYNYLMRIFKKEVGVSILEYLASVRIKNSIVLIRDDSIDIRRISKLVGYKTERMFNAEFKKQIGLTPLEYKLISS